MSAAYKSIACALYDVFEQAAVQRHLLELRTDAGPLRATILDVYARGKEEFLRAEIDGSGETRELRLDSIQNVLDVTTNTLYTNDRC